jgi:hypothetical protein
VAGTVAGGDVFLSRLRNMTVVIEDHCGAVRIDDVEVTPHEQRDSRGSLLTTCFLFYLLMCHHRIVISSLVPLRVQFI